MLLLSSLLMATQAQQVLLVGNSYTFYNNLDTIVGTLLATQDDAVQTERLAAGGLRLQQHLERCQEDGSAWNAALVQPTATWDWVVLQEQSQIPGFPKDNPDLIASLDAAQGLDLLVQGKGAETLFFLTWGRRSGDSQNPSRYGDFSTMQSLLTEGYLRMQATTTTAQRPTWVAPVGLAFAHIHDDELAKGGDPQSSESLFWSLYADDGSHPSLRGSYLAACVLVATMTGEHSVGLPGLDGMDPTVLLALQEAADAAVFGNASWLDYPWEKEPSEEDSGTVVPTDSGEAEQEDSAVEAKETDVPAVPATSCTGCSSTGGRTAVLGLLGLLGLGRVRRQAVAP